MQRNVPAENARATAVQPAARDRAELADAEDEQGDARGDHHGEAEVDQVGEPSRDARARASG